MRIWREGVSMLFVFIVDVSLFAGDSIECMQHRTLIGRELDSNTRLLVTELSASSETNFEIRAAPEEL